MTTPSPAEHPTRAGPPLPPLVVVVGPTAVGKTELSVRLAEAVGGEIISADSRQVYRGMDIGTAKATPEEQARVPHHLIDILEPDETLGVAEFQEMTYELIDDVLARAKIPFLVGGTGQYVMAVIEGWQIPRVPPQDDLRQELYRYAEEDGHEALHARLQLLDPAAAKRIDARNVRRVVRALEVCLVTGRPISEQQGKQPPPYRVLVLGLERPRDALYDRIDRRVDAMIEQGLEGEVRALVAAGYGFDLPSMSGLGYGQFEPYLAGEASLDDVTAEIAHQTHRFVRQQANWFRPDDPRIHWLDVTEDVYDGALDLIRDFLASPASSPRTDSMVQYRQL